VLWKEKGSQGEKKTTSSTQNYKTPKQQKNKKQALKRSFKKTKNKLLRELSS
jgi:hypothetical protein